MGLDLGLSIGRRARGIVGIHDETGLNAQALPESAAKVQRGNQNVPASVLSPPAIRLHSSADEQASSISYTYSM